ncbi:MAG: hypothetical protein GX896_02760 [Clostridiales bacterium]|nr:hypothetical protein [Clostridiales bacterium]
MEFSSLIFVYAFLPLTVIFSFFDKSAEYKNLILIISSLIFFTWGRPIIIVLLFVTAVMDYVFGLGAGSKKKFIKNASLALDFLMNTATFIVFSWNHLFRSDGRLALTIWNGFEKFSYSDIIIPLGIGFYTLRGMSYVFDVYHKRIEAEKNPFCILTYMMSYHFMMVGPVVRYGDIKNEIRNRSVNSKKLNDGITRFIFGLGKAVVIASAFGKLMTAGLNFNDLTISGAWLGMLGFVGYIYYLFDGFTDMALGLGLMNGFNYPENVLPLSCKNGVTGIATGFNKTLIDFFKMNITDQAKKRKWLYLISIIFSACCIGLWYGLKKGAIAGALFFAVFIILEKLFLTKCLSKFSILRMIYTVIISLAGVSMFYFESFSKGKTWLKACLGRGVTSFANDELKSVVLSNWIMILIGILIALPAFKNLIKKLKNKISKKKENGYGIVRITQTVFTLLVLTMYTVVAYNLR